MKNRLVQSILKKLFTAIFICFSCIVFAQTSSKSKKSDTNTTLLKAKKSAKNNLSKAEKYALGGQMNKAKYLNKIKKSSTANANYLNQGSNASNSSAKKADRCFTDAYYQRRIQDPRYLDYLKKLQDKVDENLLYRENIPCDDANSVVIPIAVHFNSAYDCSNLQCLVSITEEQIETINEDFAALNADLQLYNEIVANCGGTNVVSDGVCVSFCLANQNHPPGSGLEDGQPAITIGQYSGSFATGSGAPEWQGYLNIHVITGFGGGVADGIPGALNGDGVSVDGGVFGGPDTGPCSSGAVLDDGGGVGWDLGRTLTHEIGHYLGLWHTFQNTCADEPSNPFPVTDTPGQQAPNFGCIATTDCASLATNCTAGEFYQFNYMDYFDDPCLVMFSNEQAIGMNAFANAVTWANDVIDLGCTNPIAGSIASCVVNAAFSPTDGADLILCTDDGSILFLLNESSLATSWNWTFTVTSGDLVLSETSSTMENPSPTVTAGTSGTVEVTQQACDADGICDSVTHTYTITVLSGDDCPDVCDYTFTLDDTFGDTWDGAFIEVFENGVSVGIYDVPSGSQDIYLVSLTDGATIDIVYTPGAFENEHIYSITDPFGNIIFTDGPFPGPGTSFTASCSPPLCDDGVQNGSETDIDCGGITCEPCRICSDDVTEIINENFDSCTQPDGWTVTSTGTGTVANGDFSFSAAPGDLPPNDAGPPTGFAGCIALMDDDNDIGNVGIHCIVTPVIDITAFTNTNLFFDWQHEELGGSVFNVEVYDGSNWVNVFTSTANGNGSGEMVNLDAFANAAFQIRFCYDDAGAWAWGFAIDNISICGEGGCTEDISGAILSDDSLCDLSGIDIEITAPDGTTITVTTDADGAFTVPDGPYPCGDYSAEIIGALPSCYTDANGPTVIDFTVDGDAATADGPFFTANPNIPTLSQWGLIVLALLLMSFGSLRLGFRTIAFERKN